MAQSASEVESRLEAGAFMVSQPGTVPLNTFALSPSIRYADSRLSASARASAWLGADSWQLGDAAAGFEAHTPLLRGLRAEITANATRLYLDDLLQNDQLDAAGRVHLMRQKAGLWLGSGIARPLRIAAVSNVNVSTGGVWTKVGHATMRGSITSFFFTKVASTDTVATAAVEALPACAAPLVSAPTTSSPLLRSESPGASDASTCRRETRLTDVEGSIGWQKRFLEITMRGGRRFGSSADVTPESRAWASAHAAIWFTSQMAAVAGGGREPAQPTRGIPARTFGSFALMLAYWPIPRGAVLVETPASLVKAFELRPAGPALQRLTARIGGVETVEIMGDFTDWMAMPLIRRGRDMWELLLPMPAGVHQINLRIDGGAWIAPPGVPTLKDGFNGEVGVLVVKP